MKNIKKLSFISWDSGISKLWHGIVGMGSVAGFFYGMEYFYGKVKPVDMMKTSIYESYDEDVMQKTSEIVNESVRQKKEVNYDDVLNNLQTIKELEKSKKD